MIAMFEIQNSSWYAKQRRLPEAIGWKWSFFDCCTECYHIARNIDVEFNLTV